MSEKNNPHQRHYFNQLDDLKLEKFLKEVLLKDTKIMLWRNSEPQNETEASVKTFSLLSYNMGTRQLKLQFTGSFISLLIGPNISGNRVLLKCEGEKSVLFSTGLLDCLSEINHEYILTLGKDVYLAQQRSDYRLLVSNLVTIKVMVNEMVFDGIDLSAGGICFQVTKDESAPFKKDVILENMIVGLNNVRFNIPRAKIIRLEEDKDEEGNPVVKVALNFTNLPEDVVQDLNRAINAEARFHEIMSLIAAS